MKKPVISLLDSNGEVGAAFYSVRREGDKLVLDTKALDVMRVDMIITPAEAVKAFKIVFSWPVISYLLLLPYFILKQSISRKPHGS
jgi:hypothetical protein